MRLGNMLKACARVLAWTVGCLFAMGILWFAANRLLDERPDPRRGAFLRPGTGVPDEENLAVGIAGLGAPSRADFMRFGAEIKKLYDARAAWSESEAKAHGPGGLKLTVNSDQITCWIDPDWDGWKGFKECLPFEQVPQVLEDNRELLDRYKRLYKLERSVGFGFVEKDLIPLAKLAVAEMRMDIRRSRFDAAYVKWRDHFRFTRTYLHGQSNWVSKAVGMVVLGLSLPVLEDLLVKRPSLARDHYGELLELLRPGGTELIDPAGVARAEYLNLEHFLLTPYVDSPYSSTIEWLVWRLAQRHHTLNRYLAYSIDYEDVLRKPWAALPAEFSRMYEQHMSLGWRDLMDPFGYGLLVLSTGWQRRPPEFLHQIYLLQGRVRLASLTVRIVREQITDRDISAFLAGAAPELGDPFADRPMKWDSKNGRIYFTSDKDVCDIEPFRVPVWDTGSKRQQPRQTDRQVC